MKIQVFMQRQRVGYVESDLAEMTEADFFSVLRISSSRRVVAFGFHIFHCDHEKSIELSHPVLQMMSVAKSNQVGWESHFAEFRIRMDSNTRPFYGKFEQLEAGHGGYGEIRLVLDGPELFGDIQVKWSSRIFSGRIRAYLEDLALPGRAYFDFRWPNGSYGTIEIDITNGPGFISIRGSLAGSRFRLTVDDENVRKYLHHLKLNEEVVGVDSQEYTTWEQVLCALTAFLLDNREKDLCLTLGGFKRTKKIVEPAVLYDESEMLRAGSLIAYFEKQPDPDAFKDVSKQMLASVPIPGDSAPCKPVRLGVSVPPSVAVGSTFVMNFVAYLPELEELIESQLKNRNPQAIPHLDYHRVVWDLGTKVCVIVYGDHFVVEPKKDVFEWNGEKEQLDFSVTVCQDAPLGLSLLRTEVYVEDLRIRRFLLPIDIAPKGSEVCIPRISHADAPLSAFVSYCSSDRARVLDRVASLMIRTRMDIVMDCVTLRPNQRWRALIPEMILVSDMLLLFWSQEASSSEWVEWEWRHALKHKGISSIEIHPLAPYSLVPLPFELNELHGGDPLMIFRDFEMRQTQKTENDK